MKSWPADGSQVPVEDLLAPLRKATKELYELKRTEIDDANYDGYPLTLSSILSCCPNIDALLSRKWLAYNFERGHEPIDCILLAAFLLGMEQQSRSEEARDRRDMSETLDFLLGAIMAADDQVSVTPEWIESSGLSERFTMQNVGGKPAAVFQLSIFSRACRTRGEVRETCAQIGFK